MLNTGLKSCYSFINSQSLPASSRPVSIKRAVTISRQVGCGAQAVAQQLAALLQKHAPPEAATWTVIDRELMNQVLADHNLPGHLEKYLPEDRISAVEDMLVDIFGMRPTTQTVIKQTAETLLKFAELGSVILIGRAGNIVTAKVPHVLHVRLVAPLEDRVARIVQNDHKTPDEARKFCVEEELARGRYVKTYYNADINDPLKYHLMINTSLLGTEATAKMISEALLRLP